MDWQAEKSGDARRVIKKRHPSWNGDTLRIDEKGLWYQKGARGELWDLVEDWAALPWARGLQRIRQKRPLKRPPISGHSRKKMYSTHGLVQCTSMVQGLMKGKTVMKGHCGRMFPEKLTYSYVQDAKFKSTFFQLMHSFAHLLFHLKVLQIV